VSAVPPAQPLTRWRWVVLLAAGLYALSVGLLLVAGTARTEIAGGTVSFIGVLDVAVAFAVVLVGWLIVARATALVGGFARRWSYGVATVLPAAVLVGLWLARDRLLWNVLLPGLAWRTYILLACLPAALAVWRPEPPTPPPPAA